MSESGGIFGVWNHPQANQVTYFGLHALQHRGQTSAGITTSDGKNYYTHRGFGLLNHVFDKEESLNRLLGQNAIGHVRSASNVDRDETSNIQPFSFRFTNENIVLAHNGNITNAKSLRQALENKGAVFHSSSDAELLIHLIRHSSAENFEGRLVEAIQQLKGGFTFGLLLDDALYGIVDPTCVRPLLLGKGHSGAYMISSESCAFNSLGAQYIETIQAGQYIRIDNAGYEIKNYLDCSENYLEPMEFIYFSRPDSDIFEINVHSARKETGKILAQEAPVEGADMVIGVPNSSLSAASGYAEASGLPYEIGLIKHQYIGRTFIQPSQALRDQGVQQKLFPVKGVVEGKSIVLVDDSIVRGTTSKRIIKLLRQAGAREIHLRIASPALKFPNYFGIDVQTNDQLIAAHYTTEEMNQIFGSDSLAFLSLEGLKKGVFQDHSNPHLHLCESAFTGNSHADLGDHQDEFIANLTPIQSEIYKGVAIHE